MILIILLLSGALVFTILYIMQFYGGLDGKKENIIKDGLVRELITKAVADPDPNSFIIDINVQTITMGNIVIKKDYENMFWFPYEVAITDDSKYYWDQKTVGHIIHFSKDYYTVRALLKKSKTDIEQTQRQKLNLNK
jgi:hypothetical protein